MLESISELFILLVLFWAAGGLIEWLTYNAEGRLNPPTDKKLLIMGVIFGPIVLFGVIVVLAVKHCRVLDFAEKYDNKINKLFDYLNKE
jgi:hypothetical protein